MSQKKNLLLLVALTASLFTLLMASIDQQMVEAAPFKYVSNLTGANEFPPVVTDASGEFKMQTFGNSFEKIHFRIVASDLSSSVIGAHIHCAPAGVNGPISVFLFDGLNDRSTFRTRGTITTEDLTGACGFANLEDMQASIINDNSVYVNIHTLDNPGGEVRGQILLK